MIAYLFDIPVYTHLYDLRCELTEWLALWCSYARSDDNVDPELVKAASGVSQHFGDAEGESGGVFSDLIAQLRNQAKLSESQRDGVSPPGASPS